MYDALPSYKQNKQIYSVYKLNLVSCDLFNRNVFPKILMTFDYNHVKIYSKYFFFKLCLFFYFCNFCIGNVRT